MMQVQTSAAARLKAAQTSALSLTGMSLEPGCEQNLNVLVVGVVAQLESPTMTSDQIDEAAASLRRLIDTIADVARRQAATSPHEWSPAESSPLASRARRWHSSIGRCGTRSLGS